MAIAKQLQTVDPLFMQECPICGTPQRMMIRGNYVDGPTWHRFPDMGYSFCNCRHIFFTKWDNLLERNTTWNNCQYPLDNLNNEWFNGPKEFTISMLDPYFINWNCPHEMWHWQCRKVYILWDMDQWVVECKKIGFKVINAWRDMDVNSKTPQHFHVTVSK